MRLSAALAYALGFRKEFKTPWPAILAVIIGCTWVFTRSAVFFTDVHLDKDGTLDPFQLTPGEYIPMMTLIAISGIAWIPIVWISAHRRYTKLTPQEGIA